MNAKQQLFAAEYLRDHNATQAAIRAGYSKKTAKQQGSRLLSHADVAEVVNKGQEKVVASLELTAEKVLADIARIAAKAESVDQYAPAIKGHELLGKHLKLFTEVVESTATVNVTARDITDDEWDRLSALTHQVRNG